MRLRLIFDNSIQSTKLRNKNDRRAMFEVSAEIKKVNELAKAVHKEFELRVGLNQLHLSVAGFTARFASSVHGVLRDEDEVLICAIKRTNPAQPIRSPQHEKPLLNPAPTKGVVPSGPPSATTSSSTSSTALSKSSLSSATSKDKESSSDDGSKSSSDEKGVADDPKAEKVSSSEDEDSTSSSEDENSSSIPKEKESTSTSENEDSSSSSKDDKNTSRSEDEDSTSSSEDEDNKSTSEDKKSVGELEEPKKQIEFDSSWPCMSGPPSCGDILAYQILEVGPAWTCEVSEWRYGRVSNHDPATCRVTLKPWPNASVHPDPKVHLAQLLPSDDDSDSSGERVLEMPQSQYNEDGVLERNIQDFVEIRVVKKAQDQPELRQSGSSIIQKPDQNPQINDTQQATAQNKLQKQTHKSRKRRRSCPDMVSANSEAVLTPGAKSECRGRDKQENLAGSNGDETPEWMSINNLLQKKKRQLETKVARFPNRNGSMVGVLNYLKSKD